MQEAFTVLYTKSEKEWTWEERDQIHMLSPDMVWKPDRANIIIIPNDVDEGAIRDFLPNVAYTIGYYEDIQELPYNPTCVTEK